MKKVCERWIGQAVGGEAATRTGVNVFEIRERGQNEPAQPAAEMGGPETSILFSSAC
jgi:hypothetical protein